jgi:hypothetical protein
MQDGSFFELPDIAAMRGAPRSTGGSRPSRWSGKRIDVLFDIERSINGLSIERPHPRATWKQSRQLVGDLEAWLR